ncbi:family 2 glycosyl transferase [[Clostridium] sordellii]|jgi:rhamnosyltransferase|uniref:glycosyltransferase family 2 protein n=1 Tax=Paraclostridium sordellii TaxID=1505 RepID=UPI0005E4103C|nr:glycosyltransferase family 2 protein [Paeniclostridium sordellii]CEQ10466.1 family 2 glycosyl transferase [[Clostridium] sordellii] [Paeniclostridium sordellii]
MDNIISAIVTYNPNLERLKKNIYSISIQVQSLLIVDNGSENINEVEILISDLSKKIGSCKFSIIRNEENIGIAAALNQSLYYAKNNGFNWVLTLDQDSICDKNMIKNMIKSYSISESKKIAIIAPNIVDENKKNEIEYMDSEIEHPTVVITSGSLTNTNIAIAIGGFEEKLFIDYVDHEFCLRLRSKSYDIIKVRNAVLFHELGNIKVHKVFGRERTTTNHSPIRRYYYFRNSIYVHKLYYKQYPNWSKNDIMREIKTIIGIALFEENKLQKVSYIYKGLKDGIKGRYGKYSDK